MCVRHTERPHCLFVPPHAALNRDNSAAPPHAAHIALLENVQTRLSSASVETRFFTLCWQTFPTYSNDFCNVTFYRTGKTDRKNIFENITEEACDVFFFFFIFFIFSIVPFLFVKACAMLIARAHMQHSSCSSRAAARGLALCP